MEDSLIDLACGEALQCEWCRYCENMDTYAFYFVKKLDRIKNT